MTKAKPGLYLSVLIGMLISCTPETNTELKEPIAFNLPQDFVLEDIYHPSVYGQGSWVALTEGPDGRLYASDQSGKIYYFQAPEEGETVKPSQVDSVAIEIGHAHGLLWAHNSLYVSVNKRWEEDTADSEERASGVYRLTDMDNDGALDTSKMLLRLEGQGEHGPHSFVPSPDGNEIYFIAGNHTLIPESLLENSRLPTNWDEDNLFRPYLDARGHANDIKAPGGWIAKFDPEGTAWEIVSAGYRNPFDIGFNQDGELFTYDADMEWDIGMPWYRPTRINHVTSGSEYGWRTGSGKWPAYYADNLPAVHNLEQGSPTAVLSGAGLRFPSKYKNGLLIMDWSFGTIYFIDLKPKGSSYIGEREEFLSGTPLPLTDMIAGSDGHLYFATGGRGLDSHLYRLRYVGDADTDIQLATNEKAGKLRDLRHQIEAYHTKKSNEGISLAWENLNHEDRFIRYASRIALEHQPVDQWQNRFFGEEKPMKIIQAGIALARQGNKNLKGKLLAKLNGLKLEQLTAEQQVALLRNYALLFIRMGEPSEIDGKITAKKLNAYFPHANNTVTRELAQLLLYLKADGITPSLVGLLEKHTHEKTQTEGVELLSEEATMRSEQYGPLIREVIAKMPPSEAIYYGLLLSHAKQGWTRESREKYFLWFYDVLSAKGGMSFKAYMENVRQQAMAQVPEKEKEYFLEISGVYSPSTAVADLPQPIGPGKSYKGRDISHILWGGGLSDYSGTVADGERAYKAAMCVLCHRMRGEGGATGPDLTQAHTKFSDYDMIYAIYSPNDDISDQYAHTLFHLKDGKKIAGRVLSEEGDSVALAPNPFNESYRVQLAKSNVEKQELSPISPMPTGLLNRLNEQEVLDLFAYLKSGGDEKHEVYQGNSDN
ncbi:MAG: hypothetical protein AAFX53_08925 [Bacteroidota bacterium]